MRLIVIADNCSDDTADVARHSGAECFERNDPLNPGKPQALSWALKQIGDLSAWDACVVIDADTVVDRGFARALTDVGQLRNVAVQAYFDVLNPDGSWLTVLGKVLATIRYEITYPLKQRAGLNCPLTGNGMCLGTNLLTEGWSAFSLTENWELYAQLTTMGTRILYAPDARLLSEEATSMRGGETQRKRWLAGRLRVLFEWMPDLLRSSRIGLHQKLDALAELSNPGPVLQAVLVLSVVLLSLFGIGDDIGLVIAIASVGALIPLCVSTIISIRRQPNPGVAVQAFVRLPIYAAWRVWTAIRTITTIREGRWEKTSRDGPG